MSEKGSWPAFRRTAGYSHETVLLIGASYAAPALAVLTGPLVARSLGTVGRGQFALVAVWSEVGTNLFRLGLPDAAAFLRRSPAHPRNIWVAVRSIAGYATPAAMIMGLFACWAAVGDVGLALAVATGVLVAWSPLVDTLAGVRLRFLVSDGRLRELRLNALIQPMVTASMTTAFGIFGLLSVNTAVLSLVAGFLLSHGYSYYVTSEMIRAEAPCLSARERISLLKRTMSYGARTVPGSLAEMVNLRLDQLILPALMGVGELGVYAVAISVSSLIPRLGFALAQSEYSAIAEAGENMCTRASQAVRRALGASVMLAVLCAAAVPALLPALYGSAFRSATAPCLILILGGVATGSNLVAANVGNLMGRPGISAISQLVGLVVTTSLIVALVSSCGLIGAASVSCLAYWMRYLVTLRLLGRVGVSLRRR